MSHIHAVTEDFTERLAMSLKLAQLKSLAAQARNAESDLARQLALSILIEAAARDWRELMPPREAAE